MSEPLAERLSRFTPDGFGLNRDALLFAAGRASVRSNWRWKMLVGMLAASQLCTLLCLWPRTPPSSPPATPFVVAEPSRPDSMPTATPEADPSEWRALRHRMFSTDIDFAPSPSDEAMVPAEPPLHAFGTPPANILN
jgi:hypothetical protein